MNVVWSFVRDKRSVVPQLRRPILNRFCAVQTTKNTDTDDMVQVMYNTAEELCVLAWTAVLFWLPKCRWFPVICDIMTDLRVIWTFAALVLVLMVASQALPHTRYGRADHRKSLPPNTPLGVRFTHALRQMTVSTNLPARHTSSRTKYRQVSFFPRAMLLSLPQQWRQSKVAFDEPHPASVMVSV